MEINFCFVFIECRCLITIRMEMSKKFTIVIYHPHHSRQNIMGDSLDKNL